MPSAQSTVQPGKAHNPELPWWSRLYSPRGELLFSIIAGSLLLCGFLLQRLVDGPLATLGAGMVWASLFIGFVFGGKAAFDALSERKVDIDVLMVVGAGLAAGVGHPEEGALLLFLFVLAGALEALAMARTKREIEALHKLMPKRAVLWREGEWVEVDPLTLVPGDRVKIKPGEQVPADCTLASGTTAIDQSAITGESMPRQVAAGDELFAGTINTDDPIEAIVLRGVNESSLQKILNLVTTASEQREPVQRFIDRVSEPYAIGVMALSTAVFLIWWTILGEQWDNAAMTAITLLIVASPCALIIATPTATLCAIARGARAGVLFKGGQSIESLAGVARVCFDKTGTLTMGRPRLEQVHAVAWSDGKELLAMAAALEGESTHPIAAAVRDAAAQRGITAADVTSISHTTARGMSGIARTPTSTGPVDVEVRLGNLAHTEEITPICLRNRVRELLNLVQERGQLGVVVAVAQRPGESPDAAGQAAVLIMSDTVRPGARTLVDQLHALNVRPVRMLTGDNATTAHRVGAALGLDLIDAELLPEDKLRIVDSMKRGKIDPATGTPNTGGVAVIGDGVNDAPALAAADVSIAIGSIGSDAALEAADIVLLSDDLGTVPWAVRLARAARTTVKVNVAFALSVIGVMGVATLVGSRVSIPVPLGIGVLAHEGGTLLVVANSLRLLAFRAPASVDPRPSRVHTTPNTLSNPVQKSVSAAISSG